MPSVTEASATSDEHREAEEEEEEDGHSSAETSSAGAPEWTPRELGEQRLPPSQPQDALKGDFESLRALGKRWPPMSADRSPQRTPRRLEPPAGVRMPQSFDICTPRTPQASRDHADQVMSGQMAGHIAWRIPQQIQPKVVSQVPQAPVGLHPPHLAQHVGEGPSEGRSLQEQHREFLRHGEPNGMMSTPQKSRPDPYTTSTPQKLDSRQELSRELRSPGGSAARGCGGMRSKSAAPRIDMHLSVARSELAEACIDFRETAAEVRRREWRLKQLERLVAEEASTAAAAAEARSPPFCTQALGGGGSSTGNGFDGGNGGGGGRSPSGVGGVPVSCTLLGQVPGAGISTDPLGDAGGAFAGPVRRSSTMHASDDDLVDIKRERQLKKEIRLERRLRRRAEEEAAATVWKNTLLVSGIMGMTIAMVVALAMALAMRH